MIVHTQLELGNLVSYFYLQPCTLPLVLHITIRCYAHYHQYYHPHF